MSKPDFVDNRDGNTLAQALAEALGVDNNQSEESPTPPSEVRIATGYFSPAGFGSHRRVSRAHSMPFG